MDKAQFWNIIDRSREEADGDPDAQLDALRQALQALSAEEIVAFDRIRGQYFDRAYHWPLWGAAYLILGGCSDDGFMDFRNWLISAGEAVYEAALLDPDGLAEIVEDDDACTLEELPYVISDCWCEKTGREKDHYPSPYPDPRREPSGQNWQDEDLPRLLPRLTARFEG